jgi:ABC-type antimicrobial peptide transport system permease subunit
MPTFLQIIFKSLKFYKKPVLYQVLITLLLSAVITGSLLTGRSVKESLKRSATERLGKTGILISSGLRYFHPDLVARLKDSSGMICTGLLEMKGYCQGMNSHKGVYNIHIYGVQSDFFAFNGYDSVIIRPGEVAINKALADHLGIKSGEDLIIRYSDITSIPKEAPFSPSGAAGQSLVVRVGAILENHTGDFSLSISQITPLNIFMNYTDIKNSEGKSAGLNRLLIERSINNSTKTVHKVLKQFLRPADFGLRFRKLKTGEYELISDRIFIDDAILKEFRKLTDSGAPVITYLGNRFVSHHGSTPYSFVAALPPSLYPDIASGNGIIINMWMAQDLSVNEGDTLRMYWYSPDSLNTLKEKGSDFIIRRIADMKGIWADSLLMPDFPGISGKESCSDWDAGVLIKMHEIRPKDEAYWNRYRGTPKAFISYEMGSKLWGNNFGPATSIRFPLNLTEKEIESKLNGSVDPLKTGFSVTDPYYESDKAADESVDFGTLFLSLGFFIILASLVLLSFAASAYFDSKRTHIRTLFALGFKNKRIVLLLFSEAIITGFAGCFAGALCGYPVTVIITHSLNTVWKGAVQTDTLNTYFEFIPLLYGFILAFLTIIIFMLVKVLRYLKRLNKKYKDIIQRPSVKVNLFIMVVSVLATISFFVLSVLKSDLQLAFAFASGTTLLLTLIVMWRHYYIGGFKVLTGRINYRKYLSDQFYSFNPSHAVTPILFIAAGVFTIFITGANRMDLNENQNKCSGGTGGYLLWCENTIPVEVDMNSESGKRALGINDDQLKEMYFVQMKRLPGNDASCLNLNHISIPPLLGIDPADIISSGAFSFSGGITARGIKNPWYYLNLPSENNTIYGLADQTVLEWGLKLRTGDTIILRAENGQPLNIIIAAGLKSSVFQGNVLIGKQNFTRYFPSVSGNSVMLVDGSLKNTDLYKSALNERLENYGTIIEKTSDRLASFNKVTNTYLSIFGAFGALGMITGVVGLGFVLIRNYNQRKREFALLLATGFKIKKIRRSVFSEQMIILLAGVSSGFLAALVSTEPTIGNNSAIPWLFLSMMILAILITGLLTLLISVRSVTDNSLISSLKTE